jgi:hypothetical protein
MQGTRLLSGRTLIASALVAGALAMGCGDGTSPSNPAIVGKWVGMYGSDTTTPSNDYTFLVHANSTIGVIDGLGNTAEASGTWSRVGDTVSATYTYFSDSSTYSIRGVLNAGEDTLIGTWGADTSVTDGGNFFVVKQ